MDPILTVEQLDALDQDAILAGYRAGLNFTATDHTRSDQAYWHGHANGLVDRGVVPIAPSQAAFARAYVARLTAH